MSKYIREAYKGKNGKWYVHVKAKRGGKIVMDSSQGYARRNAAINEFDKLHAIRELFLLHNDIEVAIELFNKGRFGSAMSWMADALELCAQIRDLIERPR